MVSFLFHSCVSVTLCMCLCFITAFLSGAALWVLDDIRLTDIGGDSSTVAYGNRLLTIKTWH